MDWPVSDCIVLYGGVGPHSNRSPTTRVLFLKCYSDSNDQLKSLFLRHHPEPKSFSCPPRGKPAIASEIKIPSTALCRRAQYSPDADKRLDTKTSHNLFHVFINYHLGTYRHTTANNLPQLGNAPTALSTFTKSRPSQTLPPALYSADKQTMRVIHLFLIILCISSVRSRKWGLRLTFDGTPDSPSQSLLPTKVCDYVVTHRTDVGEHFSKKFREYPGDHDANCRGPDPAVVPLPQHAIRTTQLGTGGKPDAAFYICSHHMMTALGDVSGYSIASFYPKREWVFATGGEIRFHVSNNSKRSRHWYEIVVTPRNLTRLAAGPEWAPIDETYPKKHIAVRFFNGNREMEASAGATDAVVSTSDPDQGRFQWHATYPNDPSLTDRRVLLQHRLKVSNDLRTVSWAVLTHRGEWDSLELRLAEPISFTQGIVQIKTHSYTPRKDGNKNDYTDHWDNIMFSGRMVGAYVNYEAKNTVYLQTNGDRTVGESESVIIRVRRVGRNPVLFGQVHQPVAGEVLLSVNGGDLFEVHPDEYTDKCASYGWMTFRVFLSESVLKKGKNKFKWVIGKRRCPETWAWIGFSVKSLEIQFDVWISLAGAVVEEMYHAFIVSIMFYHSFQNCLRDASRQPWKGALGYRFRGFGNL